MRCAWLLGLLLPCCATAQIQMEGLQDFQHILPYLFDSTAHGATEVTIHVHWGSYVEELTPPNHDQLHLTWLNDTAIFVGFTGQPGDTLLRTPRGWITPWELRTRLALVYTETDSGGWHIEREEVRFPYGTGVNTKRSRTDSLGTVEVVQRRWAGEMTLTDTTYTGNDDVVIRVQQVQETYNRIRTTRSSLRMTEVITGFRWPTKLLADDRLGLWTYKLDRKGRLMRVDYVRYEGGNATPSGHDHVVVVYGR